MAGSRDEKREGRVLKGKSPQIPRFGEKTVGRGYLGFGSFSFPLGLRADTEGDRGGCSG